MKDCSRCMILRVIPWVLSIILGALLILVWMKKPKVITETTVIERVDTLKQWFPVTKFVTLKDYEFFEFPRDSIIYIGKKDTVAIPIPIEQRTYQDTNYLVKISGYHPTLDYIETYSKTTEKTITNTIVKKPLVSLSVGITAGYSPIHNNFDVVAGLTLSIPLYSWYFK